MNSTDYVAFTIDGLKYALPLNTVDTVIRAVEITPLPKAADFVLGIINVRGQIVAVLNICKRFGLKDQELRVHDQFILAYTSKRAVALVVNEVEGTVSIPLDEVTRAEQVVKGTEYLKGVVKLDNGLTIILDLEKFLALEEEQLLDQEIRNRRGED